MMYACKYIQKGMDIYVDGSIGRTWGVIGNVPEVPPVEAEVTPIQGVWLRRLLRRKAAKKEKGLSPDDRKKG
jgi:predicted sugar kinase